METPGPRRRGIVESRRREDKGAEGVGILGEVSPSHRTSGLGEVCPLPLGRKYAPCPSPKKFQFLSSKKQVLVHSGTDKTYF